MTINKILLIFFAGSLVFLSNCKPDPEPADPCKGAKLPTADFMLAEKLDGEERYFETDKINHVRKLYMRGPDGYDSYLWQLGTNANWSTDKNATATFSQVEGKLKVRLIAKRKPMTECFPNDDGIDTIEKSIDVVEGSSSISNTWETALLGYWEGKSTQFGSNVYTVRFYVIDSSGPNQQDGFKDFYLYNLTRSSCSSTDSDFPNYLHWTGETAHTQCKDIYTYLAYTFVENKDSIVIEYNVYGPAPDYKVTPHTFTGKRK